MEKFRVYSSAEEIRAELLAIQTAVGEPALGEDGVDASAPLALALPEGSSMADLDEVHSSSSNSGGSRGGCEIFSTKRR